MTVSQFVALLLVGPPLVWLLLSATRPGPLAFVLFAAAILCAWIVPAIWRLLRGRG